MLKRGIYLAPSQYEAGFTSLAHTEEDIDRTIQIAREVMAILWAEKGCVSLSEFVRHYLSCSVKSIIKLVY